MSLVRRREVNSIARFLLVCAYVGAAAFAVSGALRVNPNHSAVIVPCLLGGGAVAIGLATVGSAARALLAGVMALAALTWIGRGTWLPAPLFPPLAASAVLFWLCANLKRRTTDSLFGSAALAAILGVFWGSCAPTRGSGIYHWDDVDLVFNGVAAWMLVGAAALVGAARSVKTASDQAADPNDADHSV